MYQEKQLFKTQSNQLCEKLAEIDFIKNNADEIKRLLIIKVAQANIAYFNEDLRLTGNIFRGVDFQNAVKEIISEIR